MLCEFPWNPWAPAFSLLRGGGVGLGLKWVPKRRSREERSQAARIWIQKRRSLEDKVGLPPSRPSPRLGRDALGAPTFTPKAFCPNPIYSSHGAPTLFGDPHLGQGLGLGLLAPEKGGVARNAASSPRAAGEKGGVARKPRKQA